MGKTYNYRLLSFLGGCVEVLVHVSQEIKRSLSTVGVDFAIGVDFAEDIAI